MRSRAAGRRSIMAFRSACRRGPAECARRRRGAGGPVDILARQEVGVVEGARIAEIARLADACIEFDVLSVVEGGGRRRRRLV